MRICLVSGDPVTREAVRTSCEPEISIETVDLHEVAAENLPEARERKVIEHLATSDGLLFEWDVLRSHLIGTVQHRASHVGIPVIALCPDDPKEYATALLAGADAVIAQPIDPVVLKAMVVAHRRALQTAHEMVAVVPDEEELPVETPAETPAKTRQDERSDEAVGPVDGDTSYSNGKPYQMVLDGEELALSSQQHELLRFLHEHANETVTHDEILEAVWGVGFNPGTNVVAVAVHYLRKVLREHEMEHLVETVRGRGYRLRLPAEVEA